MKKNYIVISILGTLWGLFETQIGTLLHTADLPFVGLVMMACGMFFQTTARCFTRMRGSALFMAIVAAFLKLLFVGGIAVATVAAIFIQSLILEIIYFNSSPSRLRFAIAGAFAVSYSLFHPFLSMPIFMGLTFLNAYEQITGAGSALLGVPKESGLFIIFILFLVHFFTGFITSTFSTSFALKLNAMGFWSSSAIEKQ